MGLKAANDNNKNALAMMSYLDKGGGVAPKYTWLVLFSLSFLAPRSHQPWPDLVDIGLLGEMATCKEEGTGEIEKEEYRKECSHYSRGCSFVVKTFHCLWKGDRDTLKAVPSVYFMGWRLG